MIRQNISFAGAGRVATALCRKLYGAGFHIDTVVSLSEKPGRELAELCGASWSSSLIFPESTDVIFVAVPDRSIRTVLQDIKCSPDALVAHTAGSIGLELFPEHIKHRGVFYPLQTFSTGREVSFKGLPVLLESSDQESSAILEELAKKMECETHSVKSEQRLMIHMAAVFICNFTNHMLTEGKQVAVNANVPFEIFYPLLRETVSKAIELGPEKSQTGPAIRNDSNTIEKHLELLSFSPESQKIYSDITMSIINYYKKF